MKYVCDGKVFFPISVKAGAVHACGEKGWDSIRRDWKLSSLN
jgi:hypothetical protein